MVRTVTRAAVALASSQRLFERVEVFGVEHGREGRAVDGAVLVHGLAGTLTVSGTCLTQTTMRSCGMSGVQGRGIESVENLGHEAGRLPEASRARTLDRGRGNARESTGPWPRATIVA